MNIFYVIFELTISFRNVANLMSKDDSLAKEFLFSDGVGVIGVIVGVIWKPPFLSIDIDITNEGGSFWWIQLLSTSHSSLLLVEFCKKAYYEILAVKKY